MFVLEVELGIVSVVERYTVGVPLNTVTIAATVPLAPTGNVKY